MLARVPHFHLQARACAFSLLILTLALSFLWLATRATEHAPEHLTLRTVSLSLPPPPPPQPPNPVTQPPAPITSAVQGAGAVLPQIQLTPVPIKLPTPEAPALNSPQPQWQNLSVDWQALSLDELDALPSLLTPLRIQLPKSITRQGVSVVEVKVEIVVDEKGAVELLQIVSNPYPELVPQLERMVRNSRFSPPQQGGQATRARFVWPIEIKG